MLDIETLTPEDFEYVEDNALETFKLLAENDLYENDPELYARLQRLLEDEDYELTLVTRSIGDTDDLEGLEDANLETFVAVEVRFVPKGDSMNDEVHAADLFLSAIFDEDNLSATLVWFPDDKTIRS